ncbi:MAG TPA: hypothetical protein VNW92_17905 [Polyangiaceae bacterium]|nr:hypothetical protein [Polyangiaceae bacterium]
MHQLTVGGLDDIPSGARLHPIEAEADQEAFIAAGDTDFADRALALLSARCPKGRVVGIEARYSTSLGFMAYTNRMKITGYCLREDEDPDARKASQFSASR